jgi:hypothetical protein
MAKLTPPFQREALVRFLYETEVLPSETMADAEMAPILQRRKKLPRQRPKGSGKLKDRINIDPAALQAYAASPPHSVERSRAFASIAKSLNRAPDDRLHKDINRLIEVEKAADEIKAAKLITTSCQALLHILGQ